MKRKLLLKKESLAELDTDAMRAVAGGMPISLLNLCGGGTNRTCGFSCGADCCSNTCSELGVCCLTHTCAIDGVEPRITIYAPRGY